MDPRVADIMARIATLSPQAREQAAAEACGTDKELLHAVLDAIAKSSDDNLATVEVPPESGSAHYEAPPEIAAKGEHGPVVRKVGHFRIEKSTPLGRGGFGEVWEGLRDEGGFRQRVAIKILSRSMGDDNAVKRFELERQVLASLDHPEIARLIDGGTLDDGRPWLAMEYVDGVSITQFCDRERLTVEARIRLFQRVAMAVQHAHENLVIHRDIKPDNVLVTNEGGPKLLDFGIAKIVNPELGGVATSVTQAGEGVLTPDYAAPEQFTGEGIGVRSDVYSLGVLLYELLTGRLPFANEDRKYREIRSAKLEKDPPAPSLAVSTVSKDPASHKAICENRDTGIGRLRKRLLGDIDVILLKALRREPSRRYASPRELVQDLQRHLEGLPVEARPDSMAYRTTRFVARHRTGVALAASVGVAVALGAVAVAAAATGRAERMRAEVAEKQAEIETSKRESAEKTRDLLDQIQFGTNQEAKNEIVDSLRRGNNLDLAIPILEEQIKQLEATVAADPDDARWKILLVRAKFDLAQAYSSTRNPSLGDPATGEQLREQARVILADAMSAHPGESTFLALEVQLDLEAAETLPAKERVAMLTDARERLLTAEEGMGDSLDERRILARIERQLGDVSSAAGDYEAAIKFFTESHRIHEILRSEEPDDPKRTRDLAVLERRLGNAHQELKDYATARRHHERSLELREELIEKFDTPVDSRHKRDLARGHKAYAQLLRASGSNELARQQYERYLELVFEVAYRDPLDNRGAVKDVLEALSSTTSLPRLEGGNDGFARWNRAFREQIITPRLEYLDDVSTRWLAIRCDRNLANVDFAHANMAEASPEDYADTAGSYRDQGIRRLLNTIELSAYVLDQDVRNPDLLAEIGICHTLLAIERYRAGDVELAEQAEREANRLFRLSGELEDDNQMVRTLGRYLALIPNNGS